MVKKSRSRSGAFPSTEEVLTRLHQCIGGKGPASFEGFSYDIPDTSLGPDVFRIEYLWSEISSKYSSTANQPHLKEAAMKTFHESEERCALFNERLLSGVTRSNDIPGLPGVTLDAVFHTASRKIARLLPEFSWDSAAEGFGFGPGATTSLPRRRSALWNKFRNKPDCTTSSVDLASALFAGAPLWQRFLMDKSGSLVSLRDSNRVTTVPKSYKTDRIIAIEPDLGMFFQKGIGAMIRKALKKVGIDLNSQAPNQHDAFIGSFSGELATLDLKSASDSINCAIVAQLLPPDWLSALEQVRSPVGALDSGEMILYQKFSSMGNGYTFELESLIFWGLISATLELIAAKDRHIRVYGDDIVVATKYSSAAIAVLTACGFEMNPKKTHVDGPFRESCGKHFLNGFDVSPFYLRGPIRDLGDLFLLHNNIVRWSKRGFGLSPFPCRRNYTGLSSLHDMCSWLRSFAPGKMKDPSISDGYGDDAFIGDLDECRPSVLPLKGRKYSGWAGFRTPFYPVKKSDKARDKLGRFKTPDIAPMIASLWRLESPGEYMPLARIVEGPRRKQSLVVWEWSYLGPWVEEQVLLMSPWTPIWAIQWEPLAPWIWSDTPADPLDGWGEYTPSIH